MSLAAGPFALSLSVFWLGLSFFIALLVGWLSGRKRGVSIEPALSNMFLLGVVGARAGFVLLYLQDYLAQPLSILDIRDGGFSLTAGIVVASAVGAFYAWRNAAVRVPLGIAVITGTLTWAVTAGGSAFIHKSQSTLPAVSLTALDGTTVSLKDYKERPIVINLWATWCPPCRREMPVLAAAQQAEQDIVFIFINQGEQGHTITRYLTGEGLELENVLLDTQSATMRYLGTGGLPSSYFYNADGELMGSHFGELSAATLKQNLKGTSN